jgi:hypothetical protein
VEMGDEVIKERVDAMFPRDSQLTDAELHFLYGLPLHPGCAPECQEDLDRICERLLALRALSTKGTARKMTNCPICVNGLIRIDDVKTMKTRVDMCPVCNGVGKLLIVNIDTSREQHILENESFTITCSNNTK